MRALVTGATGFTGGQLARALAAQGDTVAALVRDPQGPAAQSLAAGGVALIAGDLLDRAAIARAVAGVDVVYNVAALYRQAGLPADRYRRVNALAVGELVEAASLAGAAASFIAARSASTATSSIRRRTRTRRSGRATYTRRPSSKANGLRAKPRRDPASRSPSSARPAFTARAIGGC